MRRAPARTVAAVLIAAAAGLAACSSPSAGGPPDWLPSPPNRNIEGPGAARVEPILPTPPLGGGGGGGSGGGGAGGRRGSSGPGTPSSSAGSGSPAHHGDPLVVATHLTTPVGLALLPDGTALVGERTTGRIVRVQPRPGRAVRTVRTLTGLDTRGDGGLLDLAVSPTYVEDNLIYAYITTRTDNRVVEFTLHGPVTPLFTGIPKGPGDNVGRLLFAPNGDLFVGTGDADRSRLAERQSSLAGKVLRLTDIGAPAHGNPRRGSPVWTSGQRVVDGLCLDPSHDAVFEVEAAPAGAPDEVNVVERGEYYGWPTPSGGQRDPVATLPAAYADPGGCAVQDNRLWVTSLDGRALLSARFQPVSGAPAPGTFRPVLHNRYGRLRTVVAAPDGALWLTTSNRDGHGNPVPTDERVIRYVPNGAALGGSRA